MNEWRNFFKALPTSGKVKYIILFVPSIILCAISYVGRLAEKIDNAMKDWVNN